MWLQAEAAYSSSFLTWGDWVSYNLEIYYKLLVSALQARFVCCCSQVEHHWSQSDRMHLCWRRCSVFFYLRCFYETELLIYFGCFGTSIAVPKLPFPSFILFVDFHLFFSPKCIESCFVKGWHQRKVCFTLKDNDNILKALFRKLLQLKLTLLTF